MRRQKQGFTLIELLVVISVIGVLATLVIVSFTGAQKQARDTQRKSDLAQYRNALENYASRETSMKYPLKQSVVQPDTLCATLGVSDTCPSDPRSPTTEYYYLSNATATAYALWASLENVSNKYWIVCSSGVSGESTTGPSGVDLCPI